MAEIEISLDAPLAWRKNSPAIEPTPLSAFMGLTTLRPLSAQKEIALNPIDEASEIKIRNVIDMAISFSAMNRVFEEGSKQKIGGRNWKVHSVYSQPLMVKTLLRRSIRNSASGS